MMTPLVMDYPQDENTYQLTRQYMFGPWMMVCPVTTKGALSQHVYFPVENGLIMKPVSVTRAANISLFLLRWMCCLSI